MMRLCNAQNKLIALDDAIAELGRGYTDLEPIIEELRELKAFVKEIITEEIKEEENV